MQWSPGTEAKNPETQEVYNIECGRMQLSKIKNNGTIATIGQLKGVSVNIEEERWLMERTEGGMTPGTETSWG